MMKKLGFRNICRDFRVFTGTRILTINASVPKNVWQAMNKRVNLWDRHIGRREASREAETSAKPAHTRNNSLNPRQDVYLNIKYNPIRKRSDE